MTSNFMPVPDLSKHCATALRACEDLRSSILKTLPVEKLQALDDLLAGGGSVGVELMTDYKAQVTIRLVALEREGARLVLAAVTAEVPTGAPH